MAEVTNISTEKKLILNDQVTSRDISRKFGRPEDYIELHIYNTNNQKLFSEQNSEYTNSDLKERSFSYEKSISFN